MGILYKEDINSSSNRKWVGFGHLEIWWVWAFQVGTTV